MTPLAWWPKTSSTFKPKDRPKTPPGKLRRAEYAGYETWLQFKAAYGLYLEESTTTVDHTAYAQWIEGGVLGSSAFHYDAQNLTAVINLSSITTTRSISSPEDALQSPPSHLYALDVEDLADFTADDVLQAWENRALTCGSQEAAAEMFALYRVLIGDDEFYAGATTYLYHPDVLGIFTALAKAEATIQEGLIELAVVDVPAPLTDTPPEPIEAQLLSLTDIRGLGTEQLKSAWANRPDSFATLEAAAETLSILRSLNSVQHEKPSYRLMMDHELIQELEDSLPNESQASAPSPTVELTMLRVDRRTVRTQVSVIRPGQSYFRATMLARYGGECCISGCRVDTLLEAAHIIPYRGDQSDDASNGLLLRVDLHRLFDAHLVTINPATLTVEVANSVDDAGYQAFHGNRLFVYSPKPRILFLESHYQAFKASEKRATDR
ncbi:MAG: HNH endonuclease (plasmid) [Pseudomonas rhizophila]|uniref:HNH endonuclease n=1 Tax=Pseudomonas rhizophila TaxID=2045200 RepID=UPI003F6D513C